MELLVTARGRYLICGLVVLLTLSLLVGKSSGTRVVFVNRMARSVHETSNINNTYTGNIISAPSKCKPGFMLDKRNNCRRLVFNKK